VATSLALAGQTPFGARLVPTLLGWAALLLCAGTGRRFSTGSAARALPELCFLLCVPWFLYTRQARYYPLVLFCECVALWGLLALRLADKRPLRGRALFLWVVGLLGLFYAQPLQCLVFWLALVPVRVGWFRRSVPQCRLLLADAVAFLLCLPWLIFINPVRPGVRWLQAPTWPRYCDSLAAVTPWYLAPIAASAVLACLAGRRADAPVWRSPIVHISLAVLLLPPLLVAALCASGALLTNDRYVLVSLPAALLILVELLRLLPGRWQWSAAAVVAGVALCPEAILPGWQPLGFQDRPRWALGRSPFGAFMEELGRPLVSPMDIWCRSLAPEARSGGRIFADANPEALLFCLPGLKLERRIPLTPPPDWLALHSLSTNLHWTVVPSPSRRPARSAYVPAHHRSEETDILLVSSLVSMTRSGLYQWRRLGRADIPAENSPEIRDHWFAPGQIPVPVGVWALRHRPDPVTRGRRGLPASAQRRTRMGSGHGRPEVRLH
jgi:hypothetical protein